MALLAGEALAQAPKAAEIAAYEGPDREQRLMEGGRSEGSLTLYSNAPTEDNAALVGAFTKKYAIKINLWRASSEDIRQRVLAEARAKRFDVDFVLNNAPALEALRNEHLLREIDSPYLADLMPPALPLHRQWVGFCLNVLVAAFNTKLLKKENLPKSLSGPDRCEMEGQARHRGGRCRLVRGHHRGIGREQGRRAVPGNRSDQRLFRAQGPHPPRQSRGCR